MKLVPMKIELITGNQILAIKDLDSGRIFQVKELSKYYVGYQNREDKGWYELNDAEELFEALPKNLYP